MMQKGNAGFGKKGIQNNIGFREALKLGWLASGKVLFPCSHYFCIIGNSIQIVKFSLLAYREQKQPIWLLRIFIQFSYEELESDRIVAHYCSFFFLNSPLSTLNFSFIFNMFEFTTQFFWHIVLTCCRHHCFGTLYPIHLRSARSFVLFLWSLFKLGLQSHTSI